MIGIVLSFRILVERFDGKLMLVLDYSVVRVELWFVHGRTYNSMWSSFGLVISVPLVWLRTAYAEYSPSG